MCWGNALPMRERKFFHIKLNVMWSDVGEQGKGYEWNGAVNHTSGNDDETRECAHACLLYSFFCFNHPQFFFLPSSIFKRELFPSDIYVEARNEKRWSLQFQTRRWRFFSLVHFSLMNLASSQRAYVHRRETWHSNGIDDDASSCNAMCVYNISVRVVYG
jgi:hypothetical protein